MQRSRQLLQNHIFIFIAPGFNEEAVAQCVCQLRQQKLSVEVVGATTGLQNGAHGLRIQPDISITQLEAKLTNSRGAHLFVIPGNSDCATRLLTDPRVHRMVHNALNGQGGWVASMSPTIPQLLYDANALDEETNIRRLLLQGNMETLDFVRRLGQKIENKTCQPSPLNEL